MKFRLVFTFDSYFIFFPCLQAGLAKLIGLAGETNVQASNILILKPLCGFSMINFVGYLLKNKKGLVLLAFILFPVFSFLYVP